MGVVKPWHIIVLAVVLILLFGAKRLPDAARSLGRSLRIIKAETRGLADDDVNAKAEAQSGRQPLKQLSDDEPSPLVDPAAESTHARQLRRRAVGQHGQAASSQQFPARGRGLDDAHRAHPRAA